KKHIIEKEYSSNQTELIKLDQVFTYDKLMKIVEHLKDTLNGDLVNNLLRENETLKLKIEKLEAELALQRTISENPVTRPKIKEVKLAAEEGKFPVFSYNYKNKTTKRLDTLADAKRFHNVDTMTMKNYINNKKQLGGYVIR